MIVPMPHLSEKSNTLSVISFVGIVQDLSRLPTNDPAVFLVALPQSSDIASALRPAKWYDDLKNFAQRLHEQSIFCVLTSPEDAAVITLQLHAHLKFQLWIAMRTPIQSSAPGQLSAEHTALLVFSRYPGSLKHAKTRIAYTYCPHCDHTTKDYGGKKHTYHEYGTLMSDVWRDFVWSPQSPLDDIQQRIADLFGIEPYQKLHVLDLRNDASITMPVARERSVRETQSSVKHPAGLFVGDCLDVLSKIPDNSVDFCFADPPYNIAKKYDTWDDQHDIRQYFAWCDRWLTELARVLRPGCTCAVINIPQWCVRHYECLSKHLDFQRWIVWEGLSLPVRMIMPANYSILCFSKGPPRPLPGLAGGDLSRTEAEALRPMSHFFCSRPACVADRRRNRVKDAQPITDLWWDIHRLKHNSKRVDHPCQLPPLLMYRLIALFTHPGEMALDPFNGAGTTTLCAAQLGRSYIGIELSEKYHQIAVSRHESLERGEDPFAKNSNVPKSKNSRVKRIGAEKYAVTKKRLQLEIKEIARTLGRLPKREDVIQYSQFPIEYYDHYFISWGEVCAAARTTGMSETRTQSHRSLLQHHLFV